MKSSDLVSLDPRYKGQWTHGEPWVRFLDIILKNWSQGPSWFLKAWTIAALKPRYLMRPGNMVSRLQEEPADKVYHDHDHRVHWVL